MSADVVHEQPFLIHTFDSTSDLADAFGAQLKSKFQDPWIKPFVKEYRRPENHQESTVNTANWAYKVTTCSHMTRHECLLIPSFSLSRIVFS